MINMDKRHRTLTHFPEGLTVTPRGRGISTFEALAAALSTTAIAVLICSVSWASSLGCLNTSSFLFCQPCLAVLHLAALDSFLAAALVGDLGALREPFGRPTGLEDLGAEGLV